MFKLFFEIFQSADSGFHSKLSGNSGKFYFLINSTYFLIPIKLFLDEKSKTFKFSGPISIIKFNISEIPSNNVMAILCAYNVFYSASSFWFVVEN